jgi:hypothetical protein
LFQTALALGAALAPFAPDPFVTKPLPVLATSLGRVAVRVPVGADAALAVVGALSLALGWAPGAGALAVRKVLLTLIALNDAGFFAAEETRLLESLVLDASDLAASLSDPPLMLTSVEFTRSSTISEMCLFSNSSVAEAGASPFTCGRLRSTFCESVSILIVCGAGYCGQRRRTETAKETGATLTSSAVEVRVASSDRCLGDSVAILRLSVVGDRTAAIDRLRVWLSRGIEDLRVMISRAKTTISSQHALDAARERKAKAANPAFWPEIRMAMAGADLAVLPSRGNVGTYLVLRKIWSEDRGLGIPLSLESGMWKEKGRGRWPGVGGEMVLGCRR